MRKCLLMLSFVLALSLFAVTAAVTQGSSRADTPNVIGDPQISVESAPARLLAADVPITAPVLSEGFEGNFYDLGWYHSEFPMTRPDEPSQPWQASSTRAYSGSQSVFHDDYPGWQDAWLVTPQIVPTTTSELVFWQSENYIALHKSHTIWISLGSGDPRDGQFLQLAEIGPVAGPSWEQMTLDLSAYAGQSIYIAFRYQGDWDDEWYIDNLEITPGLLSEGFEGSFLSAGWGRFESPVGSAPSALSQPWWPTGRRVHGGNYSTFHNDDPGAQDAWLVTPRFTPTIISNLVFWQSENYTFAHHSHSLWISFGSGDPKDGQFAQLMSLDPAPDPSWEEVSVDLSEYADQPIHIAFRYQGDYADEWYIDDVEVTTGLGAYHNGPRAPGEVITLTAFAPVGTNVSYIWNLGGGDIRSGAVVTKVYDAPGDYTAVVTASNTASLVSMTITVPIRDFVYLPLIIRQ